MEEISVPGSGISMDKRLNLRIERFRFGISIRKKININILSGVFAEHKKEVDFCIKLLLENVETRSDNTLCDLDAGPGIIGIWYASNVKNVTFIESNLRAFKTRQLNI